MSEMTEQRRLLLEAALRAAGNAYVPYSGFRVGAAVMTADGHISSGCNVENASYGLSVCAERAAVQSAVCSGRRDLVELVVAAADAEADAAPCGACRQVLMEFSPDMVVTYRVAGAYVSRRVSELLPEAFDGGASGDGSDHV